MSLIQSLSNSNPIRLDASGNIVGYINLNGQDCEFCELPDNLKPVILSSIHFWIVVTAAEQLQRFHTSLGTELIHFAMTHPANQ